MIKELQWNDGGYRVAVWFHQVAGTWTAIDSLKWHNTIEF